MMLRLKFRLELSLHIERAGEGILNEGEKTVMSIDARDLANQINRREEENRRQQEYQLYRAQVMKAKAPGFWRQLIEMLEKKQGEFNETLAASNSKYKIEYIGIDTSGPPFSYKVVRSDHPSVSLKVRMEPDAHLITVEGIRVSRDTGPGGQTLPRKWWHLQIDHDDNICIKDNDRTVPLNEVADEVIRYFAT